MLLLCKSFREASGVAVGLAICGCIKRLFEDSSSGVAVEKKRYGTDSSLYDQQFPFSRTACLKAFKYQDGSADRGLVCLYPSASPLIMMDACLFTYNLWNRVSATQGVLTLSSYVRVLKYLKTVVEAEFKSQHNPTVNGISATSVREVSSHEPTGSYLSVD
jgi:hypothetical protein